MKVVLIGVIILLFSSCKSSFDKANEAIENIKKEQALLSNLLAQPKYKGAVLKAKEDNANGVQTQIGLDAANSFYDTEYVNYLKSKGDSVNANAINEINGAILSILSNKTIFQAEVKKIDDPNKQMEMIQKYDRVYVLKIEK